MSHVRGILVRLETASDSDADTDDHIYIGVVGTRGGREFPLDTAGKDDFEPGLVTYHLGTIWEPVPAGAWNPINSTPGGKNDPAQFRIELNEVSHVYIRKQGDLETDDDAYKLGSVEVTLYAAQVDLTNRRRFRTGDDLWLGNEFGHQAWIPEV